MTVPADQPLFAFAGHRLLARGPATEVVAAVMAATDTGDNVLVFDAVTGAVVDLDLRGEALKAGFAPDQVRVDQFTPELDDTQKNYGDEFFWNILVGRR